MTDHDDLAVESDHHLARLDVITSGNWGDGHTAIAEGSVQTAIGEVANQEKVRIGLFWRKAERYSRRGIACYHNPALAIKRHGGRVLRIKARRYGCDDTLVA